MKRENQGLQIALIIFVMLTVILGVTTYLFAKHYTEEKDRVAMKQKEVAEQEAMVDKFSRDCEDLKEMIGFKRNTDIKKVSDQFATDKKNYMSDYPAPQQYYYPILPKLLEEINKRNGILVERSAQLQALQKKYVVRESTKDVQIVGLKQAADTAGRHEVAVTAAYKDQRDRIVRDQVAIRTRMDTARKKSAAVLARIEETLKQTGQRLQQEVVLRKRTTEKIADMTKKTFEIPDGEIRWVNQRNKTVWINRGRADSLSPRVTFGVYPADATNLGTGSKKAGIEVTKVLGEHLAEARIIDDAISDPIMPGDKIHTPVWAAGAQTRFALAGFIDINGDGKSDQHTVRNLVTMNGGKIDCESDASGKRRGAITVDTRYLVLGKAPDARSRPEAIAAYTRMIEDANRKGVEKISLAEMLNQMGWKNQTPMVRFGRGADPKDFRAKPRKGVPGVSTGNVSDVFKSRRPPRKSGGAY